MHAPPDPTTIRTTETRYGEMSYYAGDHFTGRSLELYGEYSPYETELFARFVKPGWTIVNGGANIGALTLPLADLVGPEGRVYAFEPQPEAFELLKRNTESRPWITISNCGLWHSPGESHIRLYHDLKGNDFGCTYLGDPGGTHTAKLTSLDTYLDAERSEGHSTPPRIDLIFCDIEGSEIMALDGSRRTIERDRPLLYLEEHGEESSDLSIYCRQMGYLCYLHKPVMYSPTNWKGCPEDVFFGIKNFEIKPYKYFSFNLLCIPSEKLDSYRYLLDDHIKLQNDKSYGQLKMIVPRAPNQGAKGWVGISRCGGVGDNLIAASVARPLHELGYKVEMITQTPQHVLFENNPFIDKISAYDKADWPVDQGQYQDWFRMRAKEYTKFANLAHSVECRHALFAIQTWYWWPIEIRRKICSGSYIETAHDVIGAPHTFGPLFFPTLEEVEQAKVTKSKLRGPIIAWCLSGTRIDKVYPHAPLVVGRLIKELGATVVLMGAPPPHRDDAIARVIQESVKAQNGTDEGLLHAGSPSMDNQTWPIRRIITFAMNCDLYIGGDTGPSWGVAFEPIPKIIMVSHTSVENITKHWLNTTTLHADPSRIPCWPCHRLHDVFQTCNPVKHGANEYAACISDINAETIMQTARKLLHDKL